MSEPEDLVLRSAYEVVPIVNEFTSSFLRKSGGGKKPYLKSKYPPKAFSKLGISLVGLVGKFTTFFSISIFSSGVILTSSIFTSSFLDSSMFISPVSLAKISEAPISIT